MAPDHSWPTDLPEGPCLRDRIVGALILLGVTFVMFVTVWGILFLILGPGRLGAPP